MNAQESVDAFLLESVQSGVFPGVSVCAGNSKQISYEGFFGHLSHTQSPVVQKETIYDLASLTKIVVTGSLFTKAYDEKKISLDHPAQVYLKSLDHKFTLRHLLCHASGLPAWQPYYEKAPVKSAYKEVKAYYINRLNQENLLEKPGDKALYSDLGFILLGFVLEEVYQRRLDDLAREKLILPLHLEATGFLPQKNSLIAPTENCPYRKKTVQGEVHDLNAWALGGIAGHAGLFGTAPDLADFAQAVLRNLHGDNRICTRETMKEFTRPQKLPQDSTWALAWDMPATKNSTAGRHWSRMGIGHLGFTGCSLWIDPKRDFFVVCLSNRVYPTVMNEKIKQFRPQLHELLLQAFFPGVN